MGFPYYSGEGRQVGQESVELPKSHREQVSRPDGYLASKGLTDACNVALLLGQPLLLTGEPGTGKTLFAYSLAWELALGEPLKFETKSDSAARDLFYSYDALARFRDIQSGGEAKQVTSYLTFNALGRAILLSRTPEDTAALVGDGFRHPGRRRSVILIDEVDKAPRDFPNDILNELENLYFRIPELDNVQVSADPELQPIVIITSNSEKDLPDAFLRRCVYYDIEFPSTDRLQEILAKRLDPADFDSAFLTDAVSLFQALRSPTAGLRKKPATAELLGWLIAIRRAAGSIPNPLDNVEYIEQTLSALVKTKDDQRRAEQVVREWRSG